MFDTNILPLIIEDERKKEEGNRSWRQPFLPVPDRMPYMPLIREGSETPQRGYYDSGEEKNNIWDGCVVEMNYVQKDKYIL